MRNSSSEITPNVKPHSTYLCTKRNNTRSDSTAVQPRLFAQQHNARTWSSSFCSCCRNTSGSMSGAGRKTHGKYATSMPTTVTSSCSSKKTEVWE